MLLGKKVVIVLPAFNAEGTLELTVRQIPEGIADAILPVADSSSDQTVSVAKKLGVRSSSTIAIAPTARIRTPATARRCALARTSSSCCSTSPS